MKFYKVGGAVRDHLMGLKHKQSDIDWVVVGATEEELINLGFTKINADFPVFLHPKTKEEYALARKEHKAGRGYKGFKTDFSRNITLEDDLYRRDLTINAIAEDEDGKGYIDPYGGIDDINNKILRHVSKYFKDDPLRLIRLARFYSNFKPLGFEVADETFTLLKEIIDSEELAIIPRERILLEIKKLDAKTNRYEFFSFIHSLGALSQILPSFTKLLNDQTDNLRHIDEMSDQDLPTDFLLISLIPIRKESFDSDKFKEFLEALKIDLPVSNKFKLAGQTLCSLAQACYEEISMQQLIKLFDQYSKSGRNQIYEAAFILIKQSNLGDRMITKRIEFLGKLLTEAEKEFNKVDKSNLTPKEIISLKSQIAENLLDK